MSAAERQSFWTLVGGTGAPPQDDGRRSVSTDVTRKFVHQVSHSFALALSLLLPPHDHTNAQLRLDANWVHAYAHGMEETADAKPVYAGDHPAARPLGHVHLHGVSQPL